MLLFPFSFLFFFFSNPGIFNEKVIDFSLKWGQKNPRGKVSFIIRMLFKGFAMFETVEQCRNCSTWIHRQHTQRQYRQYMYIAGPGKQSMSLTPSPSPPPPPPSSLLLLLFSLSLCMCMAWEVVSMFLLERKKPMLSSASLSLIFSI